MAKNRLTQEERASAYEAAGIPDSRPFISSDPDETKEPAIMNCHINGMLVRDLNLDPQVIAALDFYATDEGVAEKNARPNVRESSGVQLGADPFDKSLDQKRDDVKVRGMELYDARDPLREVAARHAAPGMKAKFLSPKRIQENGGTGDYTVVKDEKGDPVKVRGMVLGHMPTERAEARNRHYRERGNQIIKEITANYKREGGATAVVDQ